VKLQWSNQQKYYEKNHVNSGGGGHCLFSIVYITGPGIAGQIPQGRVLQDGASSGQAECSPSRKASQDRLNCGKILVGFVTGWTRDWFGLLFSMDDG
jgi:hypothetical protein